ncbi:MAG: glycosyltransferase [Merismopedia sp. SIO2A8]|nr:glycosyltransferase [Symploca sp. SIO2B6]NET51788.1 glycosyltransferase [Merismopedia sp. SIO2A8]
MSTVPTVSVLMPIYNAETYLVEALNSILTQTFDDFELIAINDGSTDSSEAILNSFAEQDNRIKMISRPNKGLIMSLNEGLQSAHGTYIARMDADDIAFPERFAKQVAFLDQHPDCVVVGSRVILIDSDGLLICPFAKETEHDKIDGALMAGQGGAICHPAAMIRRTALEQVNGYREQFTHCEDRDLFLRLAEIGQLANLPDTLLKYRMHSKSVGNSSRETQQRNGNLAVKEAHIRRGLEPSRQDTNHGIQPQRSIGAMHQKWAWWALGAKNIKTARKHAFLALTKEPLATGSWKVFACAIRGY